MGGSIETTSTVNTKFTYLWLTSKFTIFGSPSDSKRGTGKVNVFMLFTKKETGYLWGEGISAVPRGCGLLKPIDSVIENESGVLTKKEAENCRQFLGLLDTHFCFVFVLFFCF